MHYSDRIAALEAQLAFLIGMSKRVSLYREELDETARQG